MARRIWTLAVLLWVSADLTNPWIPGVFSFDPSECVDAVHSQGGRLTVRTHPSAALPRRASASPDRVSLLQPPPSTAAPEVGGEWLIDLRRAHPPAREAASATEDH
jgi:hypothetical protein